jgi:hypothetical protein
MAKKLTSSEGEGESIQGYFRGLFRENPKLLHTRSNEKLLKRWLADHPGEKEVPGRVKSGLSNLKSVLRSRERTRAAARAVAAAASAPPGVRPNRPRGNENGLEVLEEQIDECLLAARTLDREGLESVINLLRRARNEVVWKLGQ